MDSNSWLALLTAALVLVTGYYAWQTKNQLTFMVKQRASSVKPEIVIDCLSIGYPEHHAHPAIFQYPACKLNLSNVSNGPALDLNISVKLHISLKYLTQGRKEIRFITFERQPSASDLYLDGKSKMELELRPVLDTEITPYKSTIATVALSFDDLDGQEYRVTRNVNAFEEQLLWVLREPVVPFWTPGFPEKLLGIRSHKT